METDYFDAIKAHTSGKQGKRGVDLFPVFFGQAVDAMSRTDCDLLGDLFQGGISYGENGLYLTPQAVAELMARMMIDATEETSDVDPPVVCDPCCGTGVLLMEAGKVNPKAELVGQDIDARCARITAINLGLRGKFGWVICGNTLASAFYKGVSWAVFPKTIIRDDGSEVTVYNTVIEGRYKDKHGKYASTSYFSENQLVDVEDAAREARQHIREARRI